MSARTEKLLEEIRDTERAIEASTLADAKESVASLHERLQHLKKELKNATHALNESKEILKG